MAAPVQRKQRLLTLQDPVRGVMCHLALNCPKGAELQNPDTGFISRTLRVGGFSEMLCVREYTVYVQ